MQTLILTDNPFAAALAKELQTSYGGIDIYQSHNGGLPELPRLSVKKNLDDILARYQLVISIHCKQLFPAKLVNQVRCINVHPGLNPFNRGWFPQVFSIINGLPAGVTIHEIDELLDHGAIICQQAYKIEAWDTSGSAYEKIMALERELVLAHFGSILRGDYQAIQPELSGNLNLKKDFDKLKEIELNQVGSYRDLINRLRALTHGNFDNAYFYDDSGNKIYIKIALNLAKPDAV
jgi:dTDP-4-amino-4,6-dideoxyglucose formyltransferase